MAIGERAYFLIPKSENLPKRLFNKAFRQIVKFSKNRFFNWQALADKHCHNSEFCPVNIKRQRNEYNNS
ncbi:hypothetical protein DI487_05420 [Flavobacterium sediminis]|jgi:hypothetical protein|uniref:Uncharacterized protein n=1 Tax=Flavobacterium sediminis TaxID=2201181 RepID=A0A2U8QTD3_9FLAO|nr:hypothetical protein DI487_05420 [Flavobacterium sediminis]MBF00796.1 hypothetical protein [Flavobacterium sp.]MDV3879079.1 hypothetical protein [Elizabethkingia anophelis]HAK28249.1 hypothetical protein [Sphingobacterium sp.]HBI90125.1 hypothetical protein [Sphingobacterium sp.]|tara:strand:- start:387 stop:593 length:207 start_codon:yes stop_codon:yes gene_type:complete